MPFIGKQSSGHSKIKKSRFTATASQTDFSVVSAAGDELQVFLNGVLLKETDDYTYTTSTVTLGTGASVNDIVEVHVYQSFTIADTVDIAGDIMTGELTVPTVKLSSNVIKASDGGSTITLDTSDNVTIAGNLIIPDGGNIGSASDTDAIAIASDGGLTFSGGIDNAGTISAGTIGDNVVLSDKYYLQAKINDSYTASLSSSGVNINFDESTLPYWSFTSDSDWHVSGTGSNFSQGTTASDLKIHRAGIYLINLSATGAESSAERAFDVRIHGVGSGSSTILGRSIDNIAIGDAGGNYGNASVSIIHKFNADDQINFHISSVSSNSADIYLTTHFNICLIRPL